MLYVLSKKPFHSYLLYFVITGTVKWNAHGEVLPFYNSVLYISQSGRSKWTFPVISHYLQMNKATYICIIWAETAWRRQSM